MLVSGHAEGFICGGFDIIVHDISASSSIHFFCKVGEPALGVVGLPETCSLCCCSCVLHYNAARCSYCFVHLLYNMYFVNSEHLSAAGHVVLFPAASLQCCLKPPSLKVNHSLSLSHLRHHHTHTRALSLSPHCSASQLL